MHPNQIPGYQQPYTNMMGNQGNVSSSPQYNNNELGIPQQYHRQIYSQPQYIQQGYPSEGYP